MADKLINSLVVQYVKEQDPALAKKLAKKLETTALPIGSPNVKEVVEHFLKTGTPLRRQSLEPFASPAMKAKIPKSPKSTKKDAKVTNGKMNGHSKKAAADSSSEESSSEEEPQVPVTSKKTPAKSPKAVRPTAPVQAQSSSDSSSEEEEVKPKAVVKPVKKESSSEESSSEEEKAPVKKTPLPVKTAPKKAKKESSSEESSSEEETVIVKKTVPTKVPAKAPVAKDSSSDDSSDEEAAPPAKSSAKKVAPKTVMKESSSDESSSEEDSKPPQKKTIAKAVVKKASSSDSSDDSSDEEPTKAPAKVAAKKAPLAKKESSSDDSSSEEEEKPAPVVKSPTKKRGRESVEGAEFGNKQKFVKPDAAFNGSNEEESCELFVTNTYEVTEDDLYDYFKKYGTVQRAKLATDRETGNSRGFAFVTFDSPAEANAALADGWECNINGNAVNIRIAKQQPDKQNAFGAKRQSGDFGGNRSKFSRGDNGGGDEESNELFVQNTGALQDDSLYDYFKKFGNVQRAKVATDRETGDSKGFAFITFDSPAEAKAALAEGNEPQVDGQGLYIRMARPNNNQQVKDSEPHMIAPIRPSGKKEPFRRVRVEDYQLDPRFNNSYMAKKGSTSDWGSKAHQSLSVTRGKGFRHEKNKKKRGNYSGGPLDLKVNSIKFDD